MHLPSSFSGIQREKDEYTFFFCLAQMSDIVRGDLSISSFQISVLARKQPSYWGLYTF